MTRYLGNGACVGGARTTEARSASWWRTVLIALTGHDHRPGLTTATTRSTEYLTPAAGRAT